MALINGNEYDHIDFTKNGVTTRHPFKDTLSRQMSSDLVKVQDEEPTSEGTKIWIKPSGDSEVQVPTYEEFEELSDKINDADATIESLAVGAQPTVSVTEVDGHKRFSFGIPASNGIASITKTATDGVIDTYTIAMTDGTSTSFSVNNSDITPESMAEAIATALQDYARIDGYYPDLTAGNADQLNSTKFVENKEPYLYRPSGGSSDIGNREYLDAVVGGTVAWNQMVRDEASENQTDFADILTITDAVEDSAALKVKIEPQQDLHGYDHPWPAGGGKNIFPNIGVEATVKSGVSISYDSNENVYILNGTMTSIGDFELAQIPSDQLHLNTAMETGTRILSVRVVSGNFTLGGDSGITYAVAIFNAAKNDFMRGDTNGAESKLDGYYCRRASAFSETSSYSLLFQCWREGTVFNNLKIRVQLEEAASTSATPSAWTPYSNICPITGWDGVKVTRTGKNLLDPSKKRYVQSNMYFYYDDGLLLNAGTYTLSYKGSETMSGIYAIQYPAGGSAIAFKYNTKSLTFTIQKQTRVIFNYYLAGGTALPDDATKYQLEVGSTATDYEPYTGQTYNIAFPSEAGTVYGGTLDVSTGELVVDMASVDMGSLNWIYQPNWGRSNTFYTIQGVKIISASEVAKIRCSVYKTVSANTLYLGSDKSVCSNGNFVRVSESDYTDAASFKTAMSGVQLVYELSTPITYTLTPTEIRTLLGTNNIWADTGDLALTYIGTDEHLTLESGKKYLARLSGTDSMLLGSGQEITAAKGTDNVFDLTKMFGTSVADYVYNQGAGYFRQWFGKQWYPYNTGELKHVEGLQSHDMVGFNLLDLNRIAGNLKNTSFGQNTPRDFELDKYYVGLSSTNYYVSSNISNHSVSENSVGVTSKSAGYGIAFPIRCFPETEYHIRANYSGSSFNIGIGCYDEDGNYIRNFGAGAGATTIDASFTTPSNCRIITVCFSTSASNASAIYTNICINLSHNGSRNGEYEPYEKHSYPLDFSVILRGIPKVGANGVYWDGDRYLPDGTVERRYGVVDLGTLTWLKHSSLGYLYARLEGYAKPTTDASEVYAICSEYTTYSVRDIQYSSTAKGVTLGKSGFFDQYVTVKDTWAGSAESFGAAMQGVLLVYELATPTTETAQPYHSTQWVSDWGTEEFVSTGLVPVGSETRYPANLRDKLQHLPDAASSNGSYLITQTDGQMTLTPFPAPPTAAGKYALRATVTNGVATFTWEVTT